MGPIPSISPGWCRERADPSDCAFMRSMKPPAGHTERADWHGAHSRLCPDTLSRAR